MAGLSPLGQQQVYLVPAPQPPKDAWKKPLIAINIVIAALVVGYLVHVGVLFGSNAAELPVDGQLSMPAAGIGGDYANDHVVSEHLDVSEKRDIWWVQTQSKNPTSIVEFSEWRDIQLGDPTKYSEFMKSQTKKFNDQSDGPVETGVTVLGGNHGVQWSFRDESEKAEYYVVWVPERLSSFRLKCKMLDLERDRANTVCNSIKHSMKIRPRFNGQ